MEDKALTLCSPDDEKSCFACCPPIRPAGYEHIQYGNIIKRLLRENSEEFDKEGKGIVPITGFSCWALGYLDKAHNLIGCLLHPAQNGGTDLRYRVHYDEKCRREVCEEEKTFSGLGKNEQRFWLHLTENLDSFSYSSRRINPLFNLMGWGSHLLRLIPSNKENRRFNRESFFRSYPFFNTKIAPKANAYLINQLISQENLHLLQDRSFGSEFERFAGHISGLLIQELPGASDGPYVHLLDLDREFSDFLRLSARVFRIRMEEALRMKEVVDEGLEIFKRNTVITH